MKRWLASVAAAAVVLGVTTSPALASVTNASASAPAVTNGPMVNVQANAMINGTSFDQGHGWQSSNWSGYALSGQAGSYNDITGSWVVPVVQNHGSGSAYSSTWVGIDGFNNTDLIQTGTEQDYVDGSAQYYAWWEIMPSAEVKITTANNGQPATVEPGDHMYAHVHNNGNGTWNLTIQDKTAGWTYTTTQNYSGPADSAEWIEEAPNVDGQTATLADYGKTFLTPDTVNGVTPTFTADEAGVMVQNNSMVSATFAPGFGTFGLGYTSVPQLSASSNSGPNSNGWREIM